MTALVVITNLFKKKEPKILAFDLSLYSLSLECALSAICLRDDKFFSFTQLLFCFCFFYGGYSFVLLFFQNFGTNELHGMDKLNK